MAGYSVSFSVKDGAPISFSFPTKEAAIEYRDSFLQQAEKSPECYNTVALICRCEGFVICREIAIDKIYCIDIDLSFETLCRVRIDREHPGYLYCYVSSGFELDLVDEWETQFQIDLKRILYGGNDYLVWVITENDEGYDAHKLSIIEWMDPIPVKYVDDDRSVSMLIPEFDLFLTKKNIKPLPEILSEWLIDTSYSASSCEFQKR